MFGLQSLESCLLDEPIHTSKVRIYNVVEVGACVFWPMFQISGYEVVSTYGDLVNGRRGGNASNRFLSKYYLCICGATPVTPRKVSNENIRLIEAAIEESIGKLPESVAKTIALQPFSKYS